MASEALSDEAIMQCLQEHPRIRQRVALLLAAVQDTQGDLKRADDAEQRLTRELRLLGQEALQGWADAQVSNTERELRRSGQAHREGKKNSSGTPPSVTSA